MHINAYLGFFSLRDTDAHNLRYNLLQEFSPFLGQCNYQAIILIIPVQ